MQHCLRLKSSHNPLFIRSSILTKCQLFQPWLAVNSHNPLFIRSSILTNAQIYCGLCKRRFGTVTIPYSLGLLFSLEELREYEERRLTSLVTIPYSLGLLFSRNKSEAGVSLEKRHNPLFIRSSILTERGTPGKAHKGSVSVTIPYSLGLLFSPNSDSC